MPYSDPEQQRNYGRIWIARRRADYFANKSCANCGSKEKLELDHVHAQTKIANSIWSWSKSRRDAELLKCQVLCHSCHVQKTAISRFPDHGTLGRYSGVYKCRCNICRLANAEYRRKYRARVHQAILKL